MSTNDGVYGVEQQPMIVIRNAWKSYNGTEYILKDLSMFIPKGTIYSILGASGVGKTTLLKCITGISTLDSGLIDVNIKSRLQIGYMPQELALYGELTVEETFYVFGMVLQMNRQEIKHRMEQLINLLELPDKSSQICNMSGGQSRRISIAVAMLNNPDLLILDEPTVSLDALLKKSIWNYLEKISREEGKTIVLTTHYIEEAKSSDLVGFINDGSVLQEGHPADVIESTRCHSLEQAYYNLCHAQVNNKIYKQYPKDSGPVKKLYDNSYSNIRMLALCLKTLYYIRRNILILYVFIILPALVTVLITEIVKRPSNLQIGYVNMESECLNTEFNCSTPLSCRFLDKLKTNQFQLVRLNTVEEGREAVRINKVWGLVRFNSNFSDGVINRLEYFYALDHVEVSDEDEARIWLDMSSYPIGHMLKRTFYDSYLESIEEWYYDCEWNSRATHPLLRLETPVHGSIDDSISTSFVPGMMIMLMFSSSSSLALILILSEKELGTFERCKVSGMNMYELLISDYLFCFLTMIPAGGVQLLTLYFYSGPYNAPVIWATLLIYTVIVTGILFGIVVALLANNLSVALLVSITLMQAFYYVAGVIWPLEATHWSTRILNYILPSTIPVGTMMDMTNRGSSISDPRVYMGFINSFIWIAIFLISIAVIVHKNNKK